ARSWTVRCRVSTPSINVRAVDAMRSVEARAPAAGSRRHTDTSHPATARTVGTVVMTTRMRKIRRLNGRAICGANLGIRLGCDKSTHDTLWSSREIPHPLPLVQHQAPPGNYRHH